MFMIGPQNKNLKLINKGFTLAEAIFSLFITLLVLSILQNLLFSLKKANLSKDSQTNEVAYAYIQLERFMHQDDTRMVYPLATKKNSDAVTFVRVNQDGKKETYRIQLTDATIKVMKIGGSNRGGYMPLLFNVKKADFMTTKNQIMIKLVEFKKGKSDLFFHLDSIPSKKEQQNET